ncbi:MAG TPA: c-type cytochrome [Vicinamibacterales bacterium]|nr:c-type cytochrome [Vicinamibacterales bacterium]
MSAPLRIAAAVVIAASLAGATPARAGQDSDLDRGKSLFDNLCGNCHGASGAGNMAPPLNRPILRSAPDDQALRRIITEGIPERGMPRPRRTTENELRALVTYVRSLGHVERPPPSGNAERGAAHYQRLGCSSCHIVSGQGGGIGPELTIIGRLRGPEYLRQAVVEPGAALPIGTLMVPARGYSEFLPVQVVTRDGRTVRGVRLNEDVFTLQLRDAAGAFHSFRKSEVKSISKETGASLMPGYRSRLSAAELDDLVAYLASLGGAP